MDTEHIFENPGDSSEGYETLYSLSLEYLEAAIVLIGTPPITINYSLVIYYLLGHSAELLFKAYLHKTGCSINSLIKIGHNLNVLVEKYKANEENSCCCKYITQLCSTYEDKALEYRKNRNEIFPPVDELVHEIQVLKSHVFNVVTHNHVQQLNHRI